MVMGLDGGVMTALIVDASSRSRSSRTSRGYIASIVDASRCIEPGEEEAEVIVGG